MTRASALVHRIGALIVFPSKNATKDAYLRFGPSIAADVGRQNMILRIASAGAKTLKGTLTGAMIRR